MRYYINIHFTLYLHYTDVVDLLPLILSHFALSSLLHIALTPVARLHPQPPHLPANMKLPYNQQQIWPPIVNKHIDVINYFILFVRKYAFTMTDFNQSQNDCW